MIGAAAECAAIRDTFFSILHQLLRDRQEPVTRLAFRNDAEAIGDDT